VVETYGVDGQEMQNGIGEIFRVFNIDKLITTDKLLTGEELGKALGGLEEHPTMTRLENDDSYRKNEYPERYWRVFGKKAIVDVYDAGNGWYQVKKLVMVRKFGTQDELEI